MQVEVNVSIRTKKDARQRLAEKLELELRKAYVSRGRDVPDIDVEVTASVRLEGSKDVFVRCPDPLVYVDVEDMLKTATATVSSAFEEDFVLVRGGMELLSIRKSHRAA